jgi:hypothetical protein
MRARFTDTTTRTMLAATFRIPTKQTCHSTTRVRGGDGRGGRGPCYRAANALASGHTACRMVSLAMGAKAGGWGHGTPVGKVVQHGVQ